MCGAFSIVLSPRWWGEHFDVKPPEPWQPIYNARPGEVLPVITAEHPGTVTPALWDFRPHWLKDAARKGVINARAEGIGTKPYFRGSVKTKRCIIPADGFYEWQRTAKGSIPYRFVQRDKQPFGFAGVYDELPDGSGNIGFAIITTNANELVGKVHDRMPVVFDRPEEKQWLDTAIPVADAIALLRPYPAERMAMFAVSRAVNNSRNKGAEVIEVVA